MSFILQNVGIILLGPSQRAVPSILSNDALIRLPNGQSILSWNELFVAVVTVPLLLALVYFVQSTRQGKT